jgi:hypothetical protein
MRRRASRRPAYREPSRGAQAVVEPVILHEADQDLPIAKTIRIEGGFKIKDIMSLDADTPEPVVRAVLETATAPPSSRSQDRDREIVEI